MPTVFENALNEGLYETLYRTEHEIIDATLKHAGGNKTEAARLLKVEYHVFRHLLMKHGYLPPKKGYIPSRKSNKKSQVV